MKSFISLNELKFMLPRLAIYSALIAASTQLARMGVAQVSRFFGLNEEREGK